MKKITLLTLTLCIGFMGYAQLPETFDTEIPATWAIYPGVNGLGTAETWNHNAGGFPIIIWEDVAGGLAEDWLVSPQVSVTPTTNLLTFDLTDLNAGDFLSNITVRVSSGASQTNIPDFTTLLTVLETDIATAQTFQTFTVDLSVYEGLDVYIAFVMTNDDGDGWVIDNVDLVEIPSCTVPTDFTPGTVTTTSVEVNWLDANAGTPTWEIEWGADGFVQGTGTSVPGLTSPTYTFPGLTADTTYNFFIRTNCGGANGDSEWVGPVGFTTPFDCSNYGLPYSENWANGNAFGSCYTVEDTNADMLSWLFNDVNDLDGDGTNDNFVDVFPQGAGVAKDDWLFTPPISGVANADYTVTITYNAVDFNATANESFDLVITDTPSSTAITQSTIGSYSGITQSGLFGDTGGNDLITQAYSSTAVYTAPADGDFHVAIHANTTAANSDVFFILSIELTETLSVEEFDRNNFTYSYNKNTDQLTIESSNLPFDGIVLYSILGQKVIKRQLSETNEVIDMSSLTDGIYLATVTINGSNKTLKVIKQ